MKEGEENRQELKSLTLVLPGGKLPRPVLFAVNELARRHDFSLYLSTAQNLRLIGIREADLGEIREALAGLGVQFKAPGRFPVPKVCVGRESCNLGLVDTFQVSAAILDRFGARPNVKPKIKIAVAGCPASCSGALLADIGIVATRAGFDVYAGGKGGPFPKVGRKIVRGADEETVLAVIGRLVDFHDAKTPTKQRMSRLLDDQEFPFSERG